MKTFAQILLFLGLSCAATSTAQASLIWSEADVITGAGFGSDPRILTIQATGDGSTESGCNAYNGSHMVVGPAACTNVANLGGDEPNPHGFPKDSTPTLASLGFADADDIGIIFDATEPGSHGGNPLTMDSLILKFYSPTGLLLLSEALDNPPLVFDKTVVGNGKTDFLFVLDQAGINQVTNTIYSLSNSGTVRIALESTMSGVDCGPESFLAQAVVGGNSVVPEPATMALMGGGLIALGVLRRRRKR